MKNSLASLLSLGLGGRNTLVMFYNYPEVEKQADDFASETVGPRPLQRAIDKIDIKRQQATESHPLWGESGFTALGTFEPGERITLVRRLFRTLKAYIEAPGKLLFGRVLLDTAHLPPQERIRRLKRK